jgi:signal transduction histidine kinase
MVSSLTPEILVPRLGEYLLQTGAITEEDLQKALAYQKEKKGLGIQCLLGQALIDLGLVNRVQLDHSVTTQIIQLRTALEDANLMLERRVQERTAELQEALRKLSELSQLKANFIANISHELRTPLTHIKGYLELLSTDTLGILADEQRTAVEISQRSASNLESLIDSLILFSQASRGEMSLNLRAVDIDKVANEVIKYSRAKAATRDIDLVYEHTNQVPLVQADEEKISWAFLQLLDNAIKFTSQGGRVVLSIYNETENLVMVSVKDTGIGIRADRLGEIFEAFHQLDSSSTRRYGGTGLGLALVRDILNAHGSIIEVESEENQGSEFRFPLLVSKN